MFALRRVRDHIDRRFASPLTLSELATLSGMSRFHLVRAFRTAYGETPIRYLSRRTSSAASSKRARWAASACGSTTAARPTRS